MSRKTTFAARFDVDSNSEDENENYHNNVEDIFSWLPKLREAEDEYRGVRPPSPKLLRYGPPFLENCSPEPEFKIPDFSQVGILRDESESNSDVQHGAGIIEQDNSNDIENIDSNIEEELTQTAFRNTISRYEYIPNTLYISLVDFLSELEKRLCKRIEKTLQIHNGVKIWVAVLVEYHKISDETLKTIGVLHTKSKPIFHAGQIDEVMDLIHSEIMERNANFMRQQSGLVISKIEKSVLNICRHRPLAGKGRGELPEYLEKKKAIFNPKNNDEFCFAYSILAAIHPDEITKYHKIRKFNFDNWFKQYGLDKIDYPVNPHDMAEIEEKIQLRINVFSFYDDEGRAKYPMHVSRRETLIKKSIYYIGMSTLP